jgi:hypothetical protein
MILESMNLWLRRTFRMLSHDEATHREQKRFDLKCSGYRARVVAAESSRHVSLR